MKGLGSSSGIMQNPLNFSSHSLYLLLAYIRIADETKLNLNGILNKPI